MAWTAIDGRRLSVAELRKHVAGLDFTKWRPSGLVLHNTAAPTLADWPGKVTREQRIKNLERYYKVDQGWPSGPHAFIDETGVWLFTPFNKKGTHSPSWNGTRIGIEMVGDYRPLTAKEKKAGKVGDTIDSGRGLAVYRNAVALFAILCERLGLNPERDIALHKEDPKTTHDCPGALIKKERFVADVLEFMGQGGDHAPAIDQTQPAKSAPAPVKLGAVDVPANDTLNMRASSSALSKILAILKHSAIVEILGEAMNGKTKWLRVRAAGKTGWVAARYVKQA